MSTLRLLASLGTLLTPYAWMTHILLALAIQAGVTVPLHLRGMANAWWLGAAVSIGFWWGREKMEFEFSLMMAAHLRSVGPFWYRGWLPFEWERGSQAQFFAPAAANILLALASRWRRPTR